MSLGAPVPLAGDCWVGVGQSTSWPRARDQLQRLHVGTFTGPAGLFRQTTPPTTEVRRLHQVLDIALPPRILALDPEPAATR